MKIGEDCLELGRKLFRRILLVLSPLYSRTRFFFAQGLYCYCRYATISIIAPTGIFIAVCGEEAIGWK